MHITAKIISEQSLKNQIINLPKKRTYPMLESLPAIHAELEIIRRQDSLGAISKCLPSLFDALTSEKSTKEFFYDLEEQVEHEKVQEKESKKEVIAWMEE